jgi:DNA-binding response OmpR family regulator
MLSNRSTVTEPDSVPPLGPPPEVEAQFRLVGIRVLCIEDEPDTRELVATCLEAAGAKVLAFSSVEGALSAFTDFDPHVVVSDLALPLVDGWEMIKRLRAITHGRTVPALALSANASQEDAARALDAGFDVHLAKPVSGDDLIAAVSSVVDVRRF